MVWDANSWTLASKEKVSGEKNQTSSLMMSKDVKHIPSKSVRNIFGQVSLNAEMCCPKTRRKLAREARLWRSNSLGRPAAAAWSMSKPNIWKTPGDRIDVALGETGETQKNAVDIRAFVCKAQKCCKVHWCLHVFAAKYGRFFQVYLTQASALKCTLKTSLTEKTLKNWTETWQKKVTF